MQQAGAKESELTCSNFPVRAWRGDESGSVWVVWGAI